MRDPRTIRQWGLLALLCLAVSTAWCRAGDGLADEHQVKATFLFNFTRFVVWPTNAFDSTTNTFVIGIVGEDPLAKSLDMVVRAETVHGRRLTVRRFKPGEPLTGCQILFISRSEKDHLESVLSQTRNNPILTVADTGGMAQRGVMINLLLVGGSVKMEINLRQTKPARLQFSSKLLGLAKIVETTQ